MSHKTAKLGATGLVLAVALGTLLWSSLSEGTEYYKHVEEVMSSPEDWYGKRLQLHGFVVEDSIMRRRDSLDYRFRITNNGAAVDATYTGIVPDTFKNGSEVVVKGTLGPDGFVVEKDGVMAKCPSKYEAKTAPVGVPQ
jgi:cytochrome c-type biogenesis protein CcmE